MEALLDFLADWRLSGVGRDNTRQSQTQILPPMKFSPRMCQTLAMGGIDPNTHHHSPIQTRPKATDPPTVLLRIEWEIGKLESPPHLPPAVLCLCLPHPPAASSAVPSLAAASRHVVRVEEDVIGGRAAPEAKDPAGCFSVKARRGCRGLRLPAVE
jgi:hypothetical protein